MNHRGVTLTLSLFLLFSVIPAGAQKNKVAPKTTDPVADQRAKSKKQEASGNVLKGWADNDVQFIITPGERSAFKKLTKDEERENFIENFWLVRDPNPDTPENEFREQYYDRVDYANDHFTSGIAGSRTDRGKIYILNGLADEVQTHPSGGGYYRKTEEGGGFTNTFPFEVWRYRHLDNKGENVEYEFVDSSMSGEYKLALEPGEKDALKNVPGAGLTAAEIANGTDKGDRINKSNQLVGAMSPDLPDYRGNNEFDMLAKYNDAFKPPDVKYNDVLVPARTRLSTAILPYKVKANYIGNSNEIRTLITVQVMTKDLAFQDVGGAQTAKAQITGVIKRPDQRRAGSFSHSLVVPFPSQKAMRESLDAPQLFQEIQYLTPGKYVLHLTIEDKNSQNVGVQDLLLEVPRIPEQSLQASSMILAYSVTDLPSRMLGTDMFALGDKKVKPNITGVFQRDQNLNVWQEIYGLTVDPATHKPSATYELVISQNKQDIKTLVTESTELVGSGQQMKYTNSVPLKDFAPGQYEVLLRVKDNLEKDSVLVRTSKFTVAASPVR